MTGEPNRWRGRATPPTQLLGFGFAQGAEAPLLGFRVDPGERRRGSEKALRAGAHSDVLRAIKRVDAAALGELTAALIAEPRAAKEPAGR